MTMIFIVWRSETDKIFVWRGLTTLQRGKQLNIVACIIIYNLLRCYDLPSSMIVFPHIKEVSPNRIPAQVLSQII